MALNEYDDLLTPPAAAVPVSTPDPAAPPAAAKPANEYDALLEEDRPAQRQALQGAMFVASRKEPDRQAKVLELAAKTSLPPAVVERQFDEISKRVAAAPPDYDAIIDQTPGLARFLEDPENAALARDDLDKLGQIEKSTKLALTRRSSPGSFPGELAQAAGTGWNQLTASVGHLGAAYGLGDTRAMAEFTAERNRRASAARAAAPDYAKEFSDTMQREGKDVDRAFQIAASGFEGAMAFQMGSRDSRIKQALSDFLGGGMVTVGEALDLIREAASRPRGLLYAGAENLANSLPSLVTGFAGAQAGASGGATAGAILGAAAGLPGIASGAAAGGTLGGVAGFATGSFLGAVPTEIGGWFNEALQKRGFDITSADDLERAYSDPGLMAQIRGQAERKGLTTAAVDTLFTAVAGRFIGHAKPGAGLAAKAGAAAADVGVQAAGEAASEFAGQAAAYGELSQVSAAESLQEGILSLGHSVGDVVVGGGLRGAFARDPLKAAGELVTQADLAQEAQASAQALAEAGQLVKESKLAARMPEKLRELVAVATEGQEAAAVYFQTDDWDSYWSQKGASPAQAAEDILGAEGAKAYFEAKAAGSALEIPMGDYLARVAPKPDFESLLSITRTRADGMTLSEANDFMKALPATLKDIAEEASQPAAPEAAQAEERAGLVGEQVAGQLAAAGVDPVMAKTQSKLYEAAFRALGERSGKDPLALFEEYGLKITRGTQAAQAAGGQVLEQGEAKAPPFYSKLQQTVEQKMGGSATVEQVNGMLREIKPEERKWSGLDEFLAGKEKVSKQELLEHLAANELQIQEVKKGAGTGNYGIEQIGEEEWVIVDPDGMSVSDEVFESEQAALNGLEDDFPRSAAAAPKFSQYTLPGGENYREVLFTLPVQRQEIAKDFQSWALEKYGDRFLDMSDEELRKVGEEYKAIANQRHRNPESTFKDEYRSSHWDEANVLAHVRLNDRVDADGKKVLFVEEIQSDWHQEGRKKGYQGDNGVSKEELDGARKAAWRAIEENSNLGFDRRGEATSAILQNEDWAKRWDVKDPEAIATIDRWRSLENSNRSAAVAVPDAPFRKTWHEFAFKRILRMAAEGGYDRVAWTTGEQQADRYDLSKQISVVNFAENSSKADQKSGRKFYTYSVQDKSGEVIDKSGYISAEDLEGRIGKELTKKVVDSAEHGKSKSLTGLDLKVGGEGMKGFYDKILPDFANKFGKKYGAKVQESIVRAGDEKLAEQYRVEEVEDGVWVVYDIKGDGAVDGMTFDSETAAEEFEAQLTMQDAKVHSLDITPALRDAALNEGFSLFQSTPIESQLQATHAIPDQIPTTRIPADPRLEGLDPKALRAAALEDAKKRIKRGEVRNAHTGWEVSISGEGLKKSANASTRAPQVAALRQIGKLIEGATYLRSEQNRDAASNASFDYLYAPISVGGRDAVAKIALRNAGGEKRTFYALHVIEARGAPELRSPTISRGGLEAHPSSQPRAAIPKAELFQLVNDARDIEPRFQGDAAGARGQILIRPGQMNIQLLERADPSTFLHETGHFYLEVLGDLAGREGASQQLKDDYAKVLKWLGVKDRASIAVEHHEQWARGFEAYLMEGKAPSEGLRQAFARFKVWLITVYRWLRNLNVSLTPEVRGVMDRMLATDDEITAAQAELRIEPLFVDPKKMGMSDEQSYRYLNAVAYARQAAEEQLNSKLMADYNRAKSDFWDEESEKLRPEVEREVDAMPVYQAIAKLKNTKLDSGEPFKLSAAGVDELAHQIHPANAAAWPEVAKSLPKGTVASKKSGEGIHPDIAAELLGYRSGQELLTALSTAAPRDELVARTIEARMQERYPDMLGTEKLPEEAVKAVHNEKRSELLRMELEQLAVNDPAVLKDAVRRTVRRVPTDQEVRAHARRIVAGVTVMELKPHLYAQAERRAAKQAGELLTKGDLNGAFEAKRRELLSHELFRAASQAKEEVAAAGQFFRKLAKSDESLAKGRDTDLVNAARALLAGYGLARSEKTPAEYLEPMRKYDPEIYEVVTTLLSGMRVPGALGPNAWRALTFDDFIKLRDSAQNLWDLAKSSMSHEIEGRLVDRDGAVAELNTRLFDLIDTSKAPPGYEKARTKWENTKLGLLGIRAALRRTESWVDAMDAGDINGVFRKYILNPVLEATTTYRKERVAPLKRYLELVKGVEKDLKPRPIYSPDLGYTFSGKAELLHALLHSGNESNLSKLLRGRGWGEQAADGSLDASRWNAFIKKAEKDGTLTKADYDFAQGVWDLFESLKPGAQKAHKKLYGFYFNEITANPIQTPFGEYKGGYVPAKADPYIATDEAIRQDRDALEKGQNSFMFPTTGRGFSKSRVEAYAAPLQLDIRQIPAHLDKVVRFTHIEPNVKWVSRLVFDKAFRKLMDQYDPTVAGDMLVPWLQRAAAQRVETPSQGRGGQALDTIFREVRRRTSMNIMVANVTNALQQLTGISIAAVKVKPRFLRDALWQYVRSPQALAEDIAAKSSYMANRTTNQVAELHTQLQELLSDSKYDRARRFAEKHGHILGQATQNIVDLVTWSGAYEESVERGAPETEAVRTADAAVRQTQGSGAPEDISRFETGSPMQRAFTMFYSYFNMQANLLGTEFQKIARDTGLKRGAGRALYVYTMGFMLPAVLGEAIVRAMSGKLDEDDDDSYLDDAMAAFFGGQLRSATAMFPIVGPAVQSGINAFNDKWYDDRITSSPAVSALESAVSAPHSIYQAAFDDGSKKKAIRDSLTLLGLLSGLPVAPLARPAGYLADVAEGNVEPANPADFARGLVTGKGAR